MIRRMQASSNEMVADSPDAPGIDYLNPYPTMNRTGPLERISSN